MKGAFIVGISRYGGHMPDLPCCENDANALAKLLKVNVNGTDNFDVRVHTRLHKNEIKTKEELLSGIKRLFASEVNTALFYFSGHGDIDELGGYLITPDVRNVSDGVSMHDIIAIANRSKINNRIIILDCCSAGYLGTANVNAPHASLAEGVTILSACRENEAAIEVNEHGVFTNLLLTALKGAAADINGNITTASTYAFIDRSLGFWHQRPQFKTNVKRIVDLRIAKPPITKESIRKIKDYFKDKSENYAFNDYVLSQNIHEDREDPATILKELRKLEVGGLLIADENMILDKEAISPQSFSLTPLGKHYLELVKRDKI